MRCLTRRKRGHVQKMIREMLFVAKGNRMWLSHNVMEVVSQKGSAVGPCVDGAYVTAPNNRRVDAAKLFKGAQPKIGSCSYCYCINCKPPTLFNGDTQL